MILYFFGCDGADTGDDPGPPLGTGDGAQAPSYCQSNPVVIRPPPQKNNFHTPLVHDSKLVPPRGCILGQMSFSFFFLCGQSIPIVIWTPQSYRSLPVF